MTDVIVSGSDVLTTTIVEELKYAGIEVTRLDNSPTVSRSTALAQAGIVHARAVVCACDDDAGNLELALLARKANPRVRVVARVSNGVLSAALRDDNGPGAIFNVAELAAPSIVKACLAEATHSFQTADAQFFVHGSKAALNASVGEIHGRLKPVAVIYGENSPTPGEMQICPPADLKMHAGDWAVTVGSREELAFFERSTTVGSGSTRSCYQRLRDGIDAGRSITTNLNPAFYPLLGAVLTLTAVSTLVLRLGYRQPAMGWVDALYFTAETITTTGYGDFGFATQPSWLRIFAIALMFLGAGTVALLVAFIADVLLSQRFPMVAAYPRIGHLQNHVVIVGLSSLGIRVVNDLVAAGQPVAVIECNEHNPHLPAARALRIPIIFGDATQKLSLNAARITKARAVAVLTRDDATNIETAIVMAQMLGRRVGPNLHWPDVPIVVRVYDRSLGFALAKRFGFVNTRSTIELATPWFIGAALGLDVVGTFSVGQMSYVLGGAHIISNSELDGAPLSALPTQTQVLAIARPCTPLISRPQPNTCLEAGDVVYLVGPYRAILRALTQAQPVNESAA